MNTLKKLFSRIFQPVKIYFPFLMALYRSVRDSLALQKEPNMTSLGFKFSGNPTMENGTYEIEETDLVRYYLRDVEYFVNVGANIGYYCCIALSMKKNVVAFEPIDFNFKKLYKNIYSNKWGESIEVFPLALSNKFGVIEMYGTGTGASLLEGWAGIPSEYFRLVPVSTLDLILNERLKGKTSFILVDVEGAEKLMLEGSRLILSSSPKPIWMIEIIAKQKGKEVNPHFLSTFEMFWENGYVAFTADKQNREIKKDEVIRISNGEVNSLGTTNFIFKG